MKYEVHFHEGNMEGDCAEAHIVTDNLDITFEQALKQLHSVEGMKLNWCANEDLEDFIECNNDFVGAWIIDQPTSEKIWNALQYAEEPGGDSAVYAMQALMKGIYKSFAVKSIGKKAK
jgi:hypothetical protein